MEICPTNTSQKVIDDSGGDACFASPNKKRIASTNLSPAQD
jgi:hypothetical protein